jgi:peptidoglycan lytic transglycosylase
LTSKRTIRGIAGFACTAALLVAAPVAGAQTGGVPGGTTTEPTAQPSSAPGSWTVYKAATWYGPGFWGNQTACGVPLTPDLQGVAHRSLPCGTLVAVDFEGRSIVVPVIDRGPYGVPGADWDLTQAAAFALGMTETSTVGALRLPAAQASR